MSPNHDTAAMATIAQAIRSRKFADLSTLEAALPGRSRRSLFRDLKALGSLASFTHAGKYHSLPTVLPFDSDGLCFLREVGFSRLGTLRNTVLAMVRDSMAGRTHSELRSLLRIRAQNTLLHLVQAKEIRRADVERLDEFLYLHPDPSVAERQLLRREELWEEPSLPSEERVIAILAETVKAGRIDVSPALVTRRLRARGTSVSREEVESVFQHHGLLGGKKSGTRRPRPSPP